MRRSSYVAAPLLASAALALLTACRKQEMQRCVDENGVVVPDSDCRNQPLEQHNGGTYYHPFGGGGYYRWYYGGLGGFAAGSRVSGGGYRAMPGHAYSSTTSRGGFGSTHGSGAHGGEGGGQ
jgi:hypothetical protein